MKKIIVYFLCVVCIFMASCSHDPADSGTRVHEWVDSTINGNATMSEMKFSIGRNMVVESHAQTRTTTGIDGSVTFSTGDLIAIAVTQAGNPEEVKLYRVTSDGSLEYAGSGEPFKWERNTVSIRAWSYGTSTEIANTLTPPEDYDYSLTANQQTSDYLELLYCKAASHTYASSPVTLSFYHQLSRLVINVSHDLSTTLSITSVSVGSSTFPTTARFSVPTGSSNVGSWTPSAYGTIVPKTETTQGSYQATYSAVVFPDTYTKDSKIFTLTNSDGSYIYSITESAGQTFTAGNQYTLAINVRDDITKNPLWWVAQYNMDEGGTSFVSEQSTTDQHIFNIDGAKGANISGYHLPTRKQQVSIIPSNVTAGEDIDMGIFKQTNTVNSPCEYPEVACIVGGAAVAASTSVLGKNADLDFYAVRFINTPYASAWHYKCVTSPCNGLLIESYLLSGVTTLVQAKAVLATLPSSTTFTGSANATTANQSPESTTVTPKCFVQRFLPACGYGGSTSTTATIDVGTRGVYWSSKIDDNDSSKGHTWYFNFNGNMYEASGNFTTRSVRLFKDWGCSGSGKTLATSAVGDIICSHGKVYSPTTDDLPCGGVKVAIVAYKGNGEANSSYNTGLAISMEDGRWSNTCTWFTANSGTCVAQNTTLNNVISNYRGIEYTNKLANATCTSGHSHAAAVWATRYAVFHPAGTSQWFLPTIGQWNLIVKAMCGGSTNLGTVTYDNYKYTKFNTKITATGGVGVTDGSYWSSVEASTEKAWYMTFSGGCAAYSSKTMSGYIRPVFAF